MKLHQLRYLAAVAQNGLNITAAAQKLHPSQPGGVREFRAPLPRLGLNLHQGTSEQIAEMVASDRIDCAIATGSEALFSDLTLLPCYRWYRTVIVPRNHPLANGARLSFKALA